MTKAAIVPFLMLLVAIPGCATRQKYTWGSYERDLYDYYKDPGDIEHFAERLAKVIEKGEQKGNQVPPGIYAEYGYVLLVQGKNREAITCFERERDMWPESTKLMNTMIQNARIEKENKLGEERINRSMGEAGQ